MTTTLQPDAAQFALDLEQAEADQRARVLCEQALRERLKPAKRVDLDALFGTDDQLRQELLAKSAPVQPVLDFVI